MGQCQAGRADLAPKGGGCLTSVSCRSRRIVYFRIFCRLRLMTKPTTTPMTTKSRMPTTAAMMDVTGLGAGARVRDGYQTGTGVQRDSCWDRTSLAFGKGGGKGDPQL